MNDEQRAIYLRKARDVLARRVVLLEQAPAHVPVLAQDLAALIEEHDRLLGVLQFALFLGAELPTLDEETQANDECVTCGYGPCMCHQ